RQVRVVATTRRLDPRVGGLGGSGGPAEVERDPAEQPTVIVQVGPEQRLERLAGDGAEGGGAPGRGVGADVAIVLEAGGGGQDEDGRIGPLDRDPVLVDDHAAPPRLDAQAGLKRLAVLPDPARERELVAADGPGPGAP